MERIVLTRCNSAHQTFRIARAVYLQEPANSIYKVFVCISKACVRVQPKKNDEEVQNHWHRSNRGVIGNSIEHSVCTNHFIIPAKFGNRNFKWDPSHEGRTHTCRK